MLGTASLLKKVFYCNKTKSSYIASPTASVPSVWVRDIFAPPPPPPEASTVSDDDEDWALGKGNDFAVSCDVSLCSM